MVAPCPRGSWRPPGCGSTLSGRLSLVSKAPERGLSRR